MSQKSQSSDDLEDSTNTTSSEIQTIIEDYLRDLSKLPEKLKEMKKNSEKKIEQLRQELERAHLTESNLQMLFILSFLKLFFRNFDSLIQQVQALQSSQKQEILETSNLELIIKTLRKKLFETEIEHTNELQKYKNNNRQLQDQVITELI
jgi:cell shape-determining protein MreC